MFQFRKKNQRILGLDIGSREIKAVELTRTGGGFAVTRLASKPLVSEQAAVETLRQLAQESKFKTTRTISSVSGRSVVVRYITMQPMTAAELNTAMKYEAETGGQICSPSMKGPARTTELSSITSGFPKRGLALVGSRKSKV